MAETMYCEIPIRLKLAEEIFINPVGIPFDFSIGSKVYNYENKTEMIISHFAGKRVLVQCIEGTLLYEAEVEHLNLDTVIVRTISEKTLIIIIQ